MLTLQPEIRKILRLAAIKYNLPISTIEEIWVSQFKFAASKMAEGEFGEYDTYENIYLPNFGNFVASEAKINYFKTRNTKNEESARNL
jgi:hypothetical protein